MTLALGVNGWLNVAIAVIGALVAFGAANRMSKATECTIIVAFATVGAGLGGWVFSSIAPEHWQQPFDSLLLGGIVALLIGTRRQTIWLAPEWMPKLSIAVSALTWLAFFIFIT